MTHFLQASEAMRRNYRAWFNFMGNSWRRIGNSGGMRLDRLILQCRNVGIAELNTCYSLFTSRVCSLRTMSLPPEWDGSFEMTEK